VNGTLIQSREPVRIALVPARFVPSPKAAGRFFAYFAVHIRNLKTRRAYVSNASDQEIEFIAPAMPGFSRLKVTSTQRDVTCTAEALVAVTEGIDSSISPAVVSAIYNAPLSSLTRSEIPHAMQAKRSLSAPTPETARI
jgi:hypothetical protein